MAWSISDLFPPWGDTGERPADNFNYQGGDQVNEKHLDYLWYNVNALEDEVRSALTDLDADQDGVVDEADTANLYKGNDIDSNGDGVVDDAVNVTSTYKGNDIDSNGDGVVNEADTANLYKGNDIDSNGDGTVDSADDSDLLDGYDTPLPAEAIGIEAGVGPTTVFASNNHRIMETARSSYEHSSFQPYHFAGVYDIFEDTSEMSNFTPALFTNTLDDGHGDGIAEIRYPSGSGEETRPGLTTDQNFSDTCTSDVTLHEGGYVTTVGFENLIGTTTTIEIIDQSSNVIGSTSVFGGAGNWTTASLGPADYSRPVNVGETVTVSIQGNNVVTGTDSYNGTLFSYDESSGEFPDSRDSSPGTAIGVAWPPTDSVTFDGASKDLATDGLSNPPNTVVVSDYADRPSDSDVSYLISDGNGNSVTVDGSTTDTAVDTSSFTGTNISTQITIHAASDNSAGATLYGYSMQFTEQ